MKERSMQDYVRQLEERTPASCLGCHVPSVNAIRFGGKIAAGEMTVEEGSAEFDSAVGGCSSGLVANEGNGRIRCGQDVGCSSFVREITPDERRAVLANTGSDF